MTGESIFDILWAKRTIVLISLLFLIIMPGASFSQRHSNITKTSMTFLIMINSPQEEKSAGLFIKSLRTFGGAFSSSPIILVISDSTQVQGKSLVNDVTKIFNLKLLAWKRRYKTLNEFFNFVKKIKKFIFNVL